MAVNTIAFRTLYTGNGLTTSFATGYRFIDDSHLEVYVDGVKKALNTDYTVSGEELDAGGTVTFGLPPNGLTTIAIIRILPIVQLTDYVENDRFPAETTEKDLDKIVMILQQIASLGGLIDRSIKYPAFEPDGYISELPDAAGRANKAIGFDIDGKLTMLDLSTIALLSAIINGNTILGRRNIGSGQIEQFTPDKSVRLNPDLTVSLLNDALSPSADYAYGTNPLGVKGWVPRYVDLGATPISYTQPPETLLSGEIYTVYPNRQVAVHQDITLEVDSTLTVNGTLTLLT